MAYPVIRVGRFCALYMVTFQETINEMKVSSERGVIRFANGRLGKINNFDLERGKMALPEENRGGPVLFI